MESIEPRVSVEAEVPPATSDGVGLPLEPVERLELPENQVLGPASETANESVSRGKSLFREVVETLLLTVIIFLVVNTATGRFRIEGPSMYPTLIEGQYAVINKLAYMQVGPVALGHPQRGDIVVFRFPRDHKRDLIKRLIGLPGDTVEVKQGQVYVNGTRLDESFIHQLGNYSDSRHLGPDEYYVLGDNRNNSSDSHNWGPVHTDELIGKAWFIYWPLQYFGPAPNHSYALPASGS